VRASAVHVRAVLDTAGFDGAALCSMQVDAPPPGEPYARHMLLAHPLAEVMLARWAPGRRCAPHDHGGAAGFVFTLEGRFVETRYAWRDGVLAPVEATAMEAGAHRAIDVDTVHDQRSVGPGRTLHVYFPTVAAMRVYDVSARRTLTLHEGHGAWMPASAADIASEEPWTTPPTAPR
jgi:predicted metal-dependent enzyme (double-stranded beta helix superfamily)